MLQIQDLHKSFGLQTLFDGISLQMNAGERLGLVARNGHGKTTLFKIILGEEEYDAGKLVFPKNYLVGHLAQHLTFTKKTILEEGCLGLPASESDDHYKAESILFGLGFNVEDMQRSPSEFSGGFQIRLNLAKVLVSKPNLLLLDEPTNYLDIISMRWLVQYLRTWPGEMVIISHDRDFMDSVTTHTAAIHRQKLKKIKGGTAKLYEQIIEEEEIHEKTRVNDNKKRKDMDVFINRFRAKANKASVVQSRIKMRDKLPSLEKLSQVEGLDFNFRHSPFSAKSVLEVQDITFGYDKDNPLITDFSLIVGKNDRIAIIGKNGKGKSTLLNLMAGEFEPNAGEVKMNSQTQLGYFGQTNIDRLDPEITVEEEVYRANTDLDRTAVRTICGTMMFSGDNAEKKISVLSGGEKSRVLLGRILATPSNFLLLDEPTNHLDMESIQALTESMQDYPGALILVTHSEHILREVATKLVIFHRGGIEVFPGNYDDFLEKIGWEEEEGKKKAKKEKAPGNGLKQQNSANLKAHAKSVKKIQKDMTACENKIMAFEETMESHNQKLTQASEDGDVDEMLRLSQAIHDTQENIDSSFDVLTELSEKLKDLEGGS
jgi:ATP-binding cassette, subfamily F, member 3